MYITSISIFNKELVNSITKFVHPTLMASNSRKTYRESQHYNISNLANGKAKTEVLVIEIHCQYFIMFHNSTLVKMRKRYDQKQKVNKCVK